MNSGTPTAFTVLIVEDEQIVRETLAEDVLFETLGLQVIATAENGIEGEQLIRRLEPDIVITDIRLPGQDGLSMIERTGITHAIVLSGHADFSFMRKAIQLGIVDYLKKPLDEEELIHTLSSLIEKLKSEEEDIARLTIDELSTHEILLPSNVHHHIVDSAISFVAAHYKEPIGLHETSLALQLSDSHLSRVFKEVTGINFLGYLIAYRINMSSPPAFRSGEHNHTGSDMFGVPECRVLYEDVQKVLSDDPVPVPGRGTLRHVKAPFRGAETPALKLSVFSDQRGSPRYRGRLPHRYSPAYRR